MKAIGKSTYVNEKKVTGAYINEKNSKFRICFKMAEGEPVWSEEYETHQNAENILKQVMEG